MAWIELIEPDDANDAVREVFDAGAATYGRVLETWKAIAHSPAVLTAYLPYVRSVFADGALGGRTKDLVAIRVCLLNGCRYSLSHRISSARAKGLGEATIEAVAHPTSADFSEPELIALSFADELTLLPPITPYAEAPQAVSERVLTAVKRLYSDDAINDLVLTVAIWNLLTRYHRVMAFTLDMTPPPPGIDLI